jgi:LacI family transcriptional regulator
MIKINSKTKRRITQHDIARAVGVSHVAVSHVLHRSQLSRISVEKQEEIRRVALEMGYRPRRMTTHTVAVIVSTDTLYWGIGNAQLAFIDRLLRENGYRMTLVTYDEQDTPEGIAEILNSKTVDGVLFWDLPHGEARQTSKDIPWLFLGEEDHPPADMDQVAMDTYQTTSSVVRQLHQLGHRKMAVVSGVPGVGYHRRMEEGLLVALQELKVRQQPVIIQNKQKAMPGLVKKAFQKKSHPTAIIVSTGNSAQIILNTLLACGLEVPRDVSVVSLVDSSHLELHRPSIAATTANGVQLMRLAVERLLERIANPDLPPRHVLLPGELIPRESLGPTCK